MTTETKSAPNEIYVVTGLGIGEETKSQTVEWLTWQLVAHTILRTGGWQAGHHVVRDDGTEQMFSFFGAGTFEGANTHLTHMVISPVELFQEAIELEEKGIPNALDRITIDEDCLTTTPFHGAYSRLKEIMREEKKGTVGKGVGDALKDANSDNPDLAIRAGEFSGDRETLTRKVEAIRQHKLRQAAAIIDAVGVDILPDEAFSEMKILNDTSLVESTVDSMQYLGELVRITNEEYFDTLVNTPGSIVTETSHGALLHPRYGFVPHTTQVDPTTQDLLKTLEARSYQGNIIRIGVSRCYMTRHGAGPLVSYNETMTRSFHETHNAANERANEWLGEFRNGNYDLVAMNYALAISGGKESFDGLSISYLDVLNQHDEWQVCEAYMYEGNESDLDRFFEREDGKITGIKVHPDDGTDDHLEHQRQLTERLKQCRPVLTTLRATDDQTLEEVFIAYIEERLGLPVMITAHGPKKEDRKARRGWEHLFTTTEKRTNKKVERIQLEEIVNQTQPRPLGGELFYAGQRTTTLPPEIASNPLLLEQARQRRELHQLLQKIFSSIPDSTMPLATAVEQGLVTREEQLRLYSELTTFLQADDNHGRLVLYLPLELLPQIDSESDLVEVQLAETIRNAWIRLLYESEPRASYIDGDILEDGLGEPPRIRKAAHLLPFLLKNNIISPDDVEYLRQHTEDRELFQSINEGLGISSLSETKPTTNELISFREQLDEIEARYAPHSAYVITISPERAAWEKQVRIDQVIQTEAQKQTRNWFHGETPIETIVTIHPTVGVITIFEIAKTLKKIDSEQAVTFATEQQLTLEKQWETGLNSTKNAIITGLNHWIRLGIVDHSYLSRLPIRVPDLTQPVQMVDSEQTWIRDAIEKIQTHPYVSKHLYPVIVEVGSRVKGQAGIDTDYDGGVVFRPETQWEEREHILQTIQQDIPELQRIAKPLEFWITHTEVGYGLRISPDDISTVVHPSQVHFLLNGIWHGNAEEISNITSDLLKKYLDLGRFGENKQDIRRQLLRQIEMDMLQYRLMHKGYRRFYPSSKQNSPREATTIDWNSDFWDSGYRRTATQLFISRVFLPDLS